MSQMHDHKADLNFIIFTAAVIFVVPIVFGLLLYFLSKPLFSFAKRHYLKMPFWVGVGLFFITGFLVLYFLHAFDYTVENYREYALWHIGTQLESWGLRERLAFRIGKIVVSTLPLVPVFGFVVFPYLFGRKKKEKIGEDKFSEKNRQRRNIPQENFQKFRNQVGEGIFLGLEDKNKPIFLSEYELGMHTQVIGTTGFGKTASVLIPQLNWALEKGRGMVFIDGKGDLESLSQFKALVKKHGREKDLFIFSPLHVSISNKWNPLIRGTPTEIKDRLIGSQIWSEEFYKKKGEDIILMILNVFESVGITPSFKKLEAVLENPECGLLMGHNSKNPEAMTKYEKFKTNFKQDAKNYTGIAADISLFSSPHFGELFECEKGHGIDLLDAYFNGKIVYFHLPVLALEETAKRIGRMVIHDLKTVVSYVQNFTLPSQRKTFPVFIDEFGSFAAESFIEFLNKARSAKVPITVLHQSMGDIEAVSTNFGRQLFENTNVKIVLRIDDPETIERYSRMAGTRTNVKYTYQTEDNFLGRMRSGGASMREVQEFNIDPNEFRHLEVGEGIVIIKSSRRIHRVRLDFINPNPDLTMKDLILRKNTDCKRVFSGESFSKKEEKNTNTEFVEALMEMQK